MRQHADILDQQESLGGPFVQSVLLHAAIAGALGILGFHNAESLGATFGGRVGVEWYQVDRHMALGLGVGVRDLLGFKETIGSDTPLALDATAALRYTF